MGPRLPEPRLRALSMASQFWVFFAAMHPLLKPAIWIGEVSLTLTLTLARHLDRKGAPLLARLTLTLTLTPNPHSNPYPYPHPHPDR